MIDKDWELVMDCDGSYFAYTPFKNTVHEKRISFDEYIKYGLENGLVEEFEKDEVIYVKQKDGTIKTETKHVKGYKFK